MWHCYLPDVAPGAALRLPGARAVRAGAGPPLQPGQAAARPVREGDRRQTIEWDDALFGYTLGAATSDLSPTIATARRSCRSASSSTPRSTGATTGRPAPRWHDTVIYEVHVKGFTQRHPDVPEQLRGTYAGLGVAGGDRLPARTSGSPRSSCCRSTSSSTTATSCERGLANYWGYNTIGFFAPDVRYARAAGSARQVHEFKTMVKALHAAGIEVILDVVYNHTAEGNHLGPTLCFRGIDNAAYYRLDADDPRYYMDYTGCGNTLNMHAPARAPAHHGLPALLGAPRCTSTASASTSRRRWRASCTTSTGSARSSTSSTRIRCSRR